MTKTNKAWTQYEAGKAYKRKIGLYETVRRNERYYRGDQWRDASENDLPKPVFNLVRRVMDYLICSVASADLSIRYTDDGLPYLSDAQEAERVRGYLEVMTKNAAYRWERNGMDNKVFRLLTDAAISGDGVLYCYWDPKGQGAGGFEGDIMTDLIDSINLFVADPNRADIQSQDYLILAGRASVGALRREAMQNGASAQMAAQILSDTPIEGAGDMAVYELDGEEEAKTTYIIKFWREDDCVVFEKSTKDCVIRRVKTDCHLYPVAYMNWYPTKNNFHGTSPVSAMIPNQCYVNRAYAMAMKHMIDTAFSKIVYDKSRIPEWSNGVGEAIAAHGGGNMSDAVSVVGVGKMQEGYLDLINNAVSLTKELMGATESALGNMEAKNTSAILALQETSRIPTEQIRSAYYHCIEDLANIWADMMCAYYPSERLLPYMEQEGVRAGLVDFERMRQGILRACVEVAEIARYSAVGAQNMLDKLLDGGHITAEDYVRRLPAGLVSDRDALLRHIRAREEVKENGAYGAESARGDGRDEEWRDDGNVILNRTECNRELDGAASE